MARFGSKTQEHDESTLGSPFEADQPQADLTPQIDVDPAAEYADGNPAPENLDETPTETPAAEENGDSKVKRGRRKFADLPAVPADMLDESGLVPEEEWDSNPLTETPSAVRDAAQMKVDAKVKMVYDAWNEAGKPGIRSAPRSRYSVTPEFAPGTRAMLTRAGTFHKVKVSPTSHNDASGNVVIVFTVTDRDKPKPKSDKK
jgi:hypothetical protein